MFTKKKNEDYSEKIMKVGADKLTVIALETMVKGSIEVEGDLRLDGTIEGNVSCKGNVIIGPQGWVKGNVICANAVLYGMLQGDIQVTENLLMKAGCTMGGDVYTGELEIESGARFNGTCNTADKDTFVANQGVKSETSDAEK